ncbi:MAG: heptosyltransferase-2 [Planctomycetota bacterium]|jgi:heptosyltransferase-2
MVRLRDGDSLLVRLPSWLGDFVMAEPVVASLAQLLAVGKLRQLTLVAPPRFFDLFGDRFEGVRCIAPDDDWRGHDVALFLDGSMRSLWSAWRAGIRMRVAWSSGGRGWLATAGFRPALERGGVPVGLGISGRGARRLPRPFAAACAELAGTLGVAVVDRAPQLQAPVRARSSVRRRLAELGLSTGEPFLLLDASARANSAKAAPAELLAKVLAELAQAGGPRVVIATAPGEEDLARSVHEQSAPHGAVLFDAPPPTLAELLALVEDCDLFLGTDSGPRHLATAAARPQIIICGPSDPRHTADHNQQTAVLRHRTDCGPCHLERCPISEGEARGACMSALPAAEILGAVLAAWR